MENGTKYVVLSKNLGKAIGQGNGAKMSHSIQQHEVKVQCNEHKKCRVISVLGVNTFFGPLYSLTTKMYIGWCNMYVC
jgi:hypothetical protein